MDNDDNMITIVLLFLFKNQRLLTSGPIISLVLTSVVVDTKEIADSYHKNFFTTSQQNVTVQLIIFTKNFE